jgi:F-box domain
MLVVQAASQTTLIDLPVELLQCIVRHAEQHDIAALRSVCRLLRAVVDANVTHARLHRNMEAVELRAVTRRCKGVAVCTEAFLIA